MEIRSTLTEVLEQYLKSREIDATTETVRSHRSRVGRFVDFCHEYDITFTDEISGGLITQYSLQRSDELEPISLKSQLHSIRIFLRFSEQIEQLEKGTSEKVPIPDVDSAESARTEHLTNDQADQVSEYLKKYKYASRDHVVYRLLWTTGMRRGAIRAIDLGDYSPEEMWIKLNHRPDTETPLKNGPKSERYVSLDIATNDIITDYIEQNRHNIVDEYDREPLITTTHGRPHGQTHQSTAYSVTRPCQYTGECPHDLDPTTCQAAKDKNKAYDCPSSMSTHPLRRGRITTDLRDGVPTAVIADRMDVSPSVIETHYDQMTRKEQMEQRRESLGF